MNPTPTTSNTLTVVDKDAHRQRRKSLAPAFSEHALRSFEPIILQNVDILLKETIRATEGSQNGGWSDALNMIDRCKYFTLDVMTAFGFGQTLHAQTQRRNRGILLGMRTGSMLSGICAQYPHLRHCKAIIERLIRSSNTWTRERFAGLMRQIVKTRLGETHDAKQDLLSFIMRSKENTIGNGLTLEELWMESRMLMLAGKQSLIKQKPYLTALTLGTDTIASVFAATLFYLSRNPSCYQKLRSEIRTTFLSDAEIHSGRRLGECLYLRAAINEAMRLSPPIGMALWRETCEDITIDGHLVPAGTDMGCAMYGLFRSEDTFPRASEYIPERWLLSDAEWNIHLPDAQYAFHPFSIGSRKCVGQSMAYAELTLALAKLIWRFDFRAPSGPLNRIGCAPPTQENRKQIEQYRIVEYVTPLPDGPYLEFHCREDSTLL